MAGVEGHRIAAAGQEDAAIGIAEQQHRGTPGVGAIAGFELTALYVDRPKRTDRSVRSRIVTSVQVRGAAREAASAEFIVLEAVEVCVQPARGPAFTQVDK